jgi:hypothetical protein
VDRFKNAPPALAEKIDALNIFSRAYAAGMVFREMPIKGGDTIARSAPLNAECSCCKMAHEIFLCLDAERVPKVRNSVAARGCSRPSFLIHFGDVLSRNKSLFQELS